MKKYEYKVASVEISASKDQVNKELNAFGEEGWEIISVVDYSNLGLTQIIFEASVTSGLIIFMKRERNIA